MFQIVVIGGTGLIGSKVVAKLQERGHDAVAAAPNTGVNTITGEGLAEVMESAEIVVDVSNSPSFEAEPAMEFFQTSGRNIADAEKAAGVRHHIALSVVGTDRLQESGYFRAKLAQEELIRNSGIPYSLVHATQFFEFIRGIADISTVEGFIRVAPVQFQPMAAEDTASAVVEVALGNPVNGIVEIAGPEVFTLDQPIRKVLEKDGDPRQIVLDPEALYSGAHVSENTLVPSAGARLGKTDFAWWLEHAPPPPPKR